MNILAKEFHFYLVHTARDKTVYKPLIIEELRRHPLFSHLTKEELQMFSIHTT